MKNTKKILLLCSVILITFFSCKDDSLQIIPDWETGVNTYTTRKAGSASGFENGNASVPMELNFRWITIDGANTVTKIEYYLLFNEGYVDKDNNPAVARHGGTAGKLFKTIEGSAVPANRTDVAVTITMDDVYQLYKNNKYNYCGTEVDVFSNTLKPARKASIPFIAGDTFSLKWIVYTEDGRKFDSWSPSVCNEFPGSNCVYSWAIVCPSDLAGTYSYVTTNIVSDGGTDGGPATGTGTLTKTTSGNYAVSDVSFGMYDFSYGAGLTSKNVVLNDACAFLSYKPNVDQYSTFWTLTVLSVSADRKDLSIKWETNFGEKGNTVLTRTDAKLWPANLTTTPSGSCN